MNKVSLLIIGGTAEVRKGLVMSLAAEPDFDIVGETEHCEDALRMLDRTKPDVVVIDLDMPRGDGLALAEKACRLSPRSRLIVLSLQDDVFTFARARKAGASLVAKTAPTATLFATIRALAV